ncbi:MAG: alkaline phosphatase family protein [Chloroflexota bacterium]
MKEINRKLGLSLFLVTGLLVLSLAGCAADLSTSPTSPTSSPTPTTAPTVKPSPTPTVLSTPRNIILIGWDGAQRNHVKESLGRGELPNLKKLISEGNLVAIDIYRTTDTKAGWAQILTGYEPEVTGVYGNGRYQPIPRGYTIFERLESFFGSDRFVTVAVIGKKEHVDDDPPLRRPYREGDRIEGKIITEDGKKYQLIPGKPYYHTRESLDLFLNGLNEDEKVGSKALELLEQYKDKPFFFLVHFAQVDHKGHSFGENSREYNDALISADTWTGKLMEKLRQLNLYDKTLIYVTADHGFDEGMTSHNDAPYVFLGTNDPQVIRRGSRADIAPTILERFGLKLSQFTPPLDGHPLTKPYQPPLW